MEFHDDLVREGGLITLVFQASLEDGECQEYAAFSLAHLSSNRDYQTRIVEAGALKPLVAMMSVHAEPRHYAGLALLKLADNFENHIAIAEEGGIQVCVGRAKCGCLCLCCCWLLLLLVLFFFVSSSEHSVGLCCCEFRRCSDWPVPAPRTRSCSTKQRSPLVTWPPTPSSCCPRASPRRCRSAALRRVTSRLPNGVPRWRPWARRAALELVLVLVLARVLAPSPVLTLRSAHGTTWTGRSPARPVVVQRSKESCCRVLLFHVMVKAL